MNSALELQITGLRRRLGLLRNRWRSYWHTRRVLAEWHFAGHPVPPPHAHKVQVVKSYGRRFKTLTLVETGTYRAQMLLAIHNVFRVIHSVELSQELYTAALIVTAAYPNVKLWQGDSAAILQGILASLRGPCLFWLDAHYSGGETARGSVDTPIMHELKQILDYQTIVPVVLIDDARAFGTMADYPTLAGLRQLVDAVRPGWSLTVVDDIIRIHAVT